MKNRIHHIRLRTLVAHSHPLNRQVDGGHQLLMDTARNRDDDASVEMDPETE